MAASEEKYIITAKSPAETPNISYGQYTLDRLRNNPMRIIQVDGRTGQLFTNRDLLERSVKLAVALEDRGVNAGDTIAISAENHLNWFIPVLAVLYRGAVISPMNPGYSKGEVTHCFNITKPKIVFVSRRSEKLISEVVKTLPWKIEILQLDDLPLSKGVISLKSILDESRIWPDPYVYNAVKIERPDLHEGAVLYSSGTTGPPKGVMLSHRNLFIQGLAFGSPEFMNLMDSDVVLIPLPFFHGYGFGLMMTIIHAGSMAITMANFDSELYLQLIKKYKVTYLPVAPPMMNFFAKHPLVSHYDYSSIREISCGAAPLSPEIRRDALKRLGNPILRNGYGMTELSIIITVSARNTTKVDTIGFLARGQSCKVIDLKTSKALGPRETGELCFKGDHVMLGYRDNPKATAETIDKDGWLHTGDLGYYDEDGDIFVVDRLKELIKYKGYQVSPSEIESLLLSHSDIVDAAVIGKPDEEAGELPMAFVVKRGDSKITAEEVRKYVDEQVSTQSKLRGGIRFINSIPKNPGGKILRKELRNLVAKL